MSERLYGRQQARPIKPAIQSLFETLLPQILWDPSLSFKILWVEIGFGGGEHLYTQAQTHPEVLCVGCEPFKNGIASLLKKMNEEFLPNLRIVPSEGLTFLKTLSDRSIHRLFLLFPDPWPKKRHHKRRWIQKESLNEVKRVLKKEGEWRIATDHPSYQEWIKRTLSKDVDFTLETLPSRPSLLEWPQTRYEAKAEREGRTSLFFCVQHA